MAIKTRILIISDTHGDTFDIVPGHKADVVIHCGDLTQESKLEEYRRTIQFLNALDAPLKLVIAGNHDFSLDDESFKLKIEEVAGTIEPALIHKEFGEYGEARRLFNEAPGITFLDEGTHTFKLDNGASMTVYASPYTPSEDGNSLQYHPGTGHEFNIQKNTDIVITHGPPLGILDRPKGVARKGCDHLFRAVLEARPLLHCFGHIHQGWGARFVSWKEMPDAPDHFSAIDNDHSTTIDSLPFLTDSILDTPQGITKKHQRVAQYKQQGYCATSHCRGNKNALQGGRHTLFVNAAMKGHATDVLPIHPPWVVDIDLPSAD